MFVFTYLLVGLVRLIVWIALFVTVLALWTFNLVLALFSRFQKRADR